MASSGSCLAGRDAVIHFSLLAAQIDGPGTARDEHLSRLPVWQILPVRGYAGPTLKRAISGPRPFPRSSRCFQRQRLDSPLSPGCQASKSFWPVERTWNPPGVQSPATCKSSPLPMSSGAGHERHSLCFCRSCKRPLKSPLSLRPGRVLTDSWLAGQNPPSPCLTFHQEAISSQDFTS